MTEKIVQLNEEVIKGQIKEPVRGSVEETLNELLEAEANKLTKAAGMSAMSSGKVIAVTITTAISPPLPEMSHSRCPSSRASHLKPPSLSGFAVRRAVRKRLTLKCIWPVYPPGVWRTSTNAHFFTASKETDDLFSMGNL